MFNSLFLILGLILILWGANALTDGASSVAKRFNVSDLVIGLTIVAFGTSAPEFIISLLAAIKGSSDIAIGNIIGSNIFNILIILGITAIIIPLRVPRSTLYKEIPFAILASIMLYICANDKLINNDPINMISRTDGLIFIGFFLIFIAYTLAIAHNQEEKEVSVSKEMSGWKSTLLILGGLAALIEGGNLFVNGASGIARDLGVRESVIGLTLVAGGTSLPELATSLTAAFKKKPGMAIGNVVGSNLFNIFFVLGCSASIRPLPVGNITSLDFYVLIGSSLLLWITGKFFGKRTINRMEGSTMVICFVTYITYLIIKQ